MPMLLRRYSCKFLWGGAIMIGQPIMEYNRTQRHRTLLPSPRTFIAQGIENLRASVGL
jgi:hypothetical protein